jgi:hypothetical protein
MTWVMELPLGVPDPLFVCELALELCKSVREIGESMSAHELCVVWPAFFEARRRMHEAEEAKRAGR